MAVRWACPTLAVELDGETYTVATIPRDQMRYREDTGEAITARGEDMGALATLAWIACRRLKITTDELEPFLDKLTNVGAVTQDPLDRLNGES